MDSEITEKEVFETAVRIQVCENKNLEVNFSPDGLRVILPPKRMLAQCCSVPLSKMTAVLSEMEQNQLIATEQRGGMWTTRMGNRIIAGLLKHKYRKEAEVLLGPVLLENILQRLLQVE